jgi:hypothetical protein
MNQGEGPSQEIVAEIDQAGANVEKELDARKLCSIAWGPYSSKEEADDAKVALSELGYNPGVVDEKNGRRDFDNPLSAAQSFDQLEMHKNQ